jgi:hypothetical protein
MENLKELNEIFVDLIKMIPKKHYRQAENLTKDSKYAFNKKEQDQKNILKQKSKRMRLDPNALSTDEVAVVEEGKQQQNKDEMEQVNRIEQDEDEDEFHTDVQSDSEREEIFFSPRSGPEEQLSKPVNLKDLLRQKIDSFEKKRKIRTEKRERPSKKEKKEAKKIKAKHQKKKDPKPSADLIVPSEAKSEPVKVEFAIKKNKKPVKHHNAETALQLLNAKKEKIKKLPTGEKQKLMEKEAWKKASILSQGGEVKDDETRLKKAIKKKEKLKEKRTREWSNRIASQKSAFDQKQAKRTENIEKRIQTIKDKRKGIKKSTSHKKGKGSKGKSSFKGKK